MCHQWGPSPAPNSLPTPEQLASQVLVREPRRWSSDLPTGYLLVLAGASTSGPARAFSPSMVSSSTSAAVSTSSLSPYAEFRPDKWNSQEDN
ncbi:hypothetical protein NIBR502772_00335 [Pseudarthrobacter sp. NIBRBAC000502772]|nr:hypothetical protein NIBR502772_00335 [Pseudarthrobacter sp. NIBRBAC000502772]